MEFPSHHPVLTGGSLMGKIRSWTEKEVIKTNKQNITHIHTL